MNQVKKQHYVPQFYLSQFANSQSQVSVYDKFNQKTFLANPKDVAQRKHFYDFSQDFLKAIEETLADESTIDHFGKDRVDEVKSHIQSVQIIENQLSQWEGRFARVLKDVLESLEKRRRFKVRLREDLALFMAVQYWRTFERRRTMMQMLQSAENGITNILDRINEKRGTNYTTKDVDFEYDENETADMHRMSVIDLDNIRKTATIFQSHIWTIAVNDTNQPFYTSDNPVAKRAHKSHAWLSNSGYASPGIQLMFPLSPKYVLELYERSYWRDVEPYENQLVYQKKDHVTFLNSSQVYSSYRQIYSASNSFELVERMLEENESLKNPLDRYR